MLAKILLDSPAAPRELKTLLRYDNKARDLTKAGMKDGVAKAGCFLLFLSTGVLARPYVQVRWQLHAAPLHLSPL